VSALNISVKVQDQKAILKISGSQSRHASNSLEVS
jgi:hypothetical protein